MEIVGSLLTHDYGLSLYGYVGCCEFLEPQKPVVVPLTEQQKATVKDDLAGVLKNKECEDVVEALIAQAEKNTGFKAFSHNLMDTFGKVTSFGSDGRRQEYDAAAGSNAGSPGGIALTVNYPLSNDDPLIRNLNGRKMIHEMFHGNRDGDLTALGSGERSYTHLDMQQAAWDVAHARGLTNYMSAGVAVFSGKRPTVDDGSSLMFGELIYKYCKTWEQP